MNSVVRRLILDVCFTKNIGLMSGKMGVCLFFYRHARHTDVMRYATFAGELLDDIYGEINTTTSHNFDDGLAGICWGIEYLARNGYVDADTDEVLSNIDLSIMERDPRRITDCSLGKGLIGLAHYVLARCNDKARLPIDRQYIIDIHSSITRREYNTELTVKLEKLLAGEPTNYNFELANMIIDSICNKRKSI